MLVDACHRIDQVALNRLDVEPNVSSYLSYPKYAIFGGLFESSIRCTFAGCSFARKRVESFFGLQVSIPTWPEVTVKVAIEQAQVWERLRQSVCPECHKDVREKRLVVERWPRDLVVHVKRWSRGPFGRRWVKDQRGIHFDPQLTVGTGIGAKQYDLRAVICHSGLATSGHYVAYGTLGGGSPSGQWYKCDDRVVRECAWAEVVKDQAYVLFYEGPP